MKIFLQMLLALLCVFFLLMSACGGLFLFVIGLSPGWHLGDLWLPVGSLAIGAVGLWVTVRAFRNTNKKKVNGGAPNA